jgi:hypothetical protein
MYSYPNRIYTPSSNCTTPCSPKHLLSFTTIIDASFPFNFTPFYFTSLPFCFTPFKFSATSLHFTSPQFTSLHFASFRCTFIRFSPHFCYLHFTPFIIAFLTLFLKMLRLRGKVPNSTAGSWYFPISVLCFLSLIFRT